MDYKRLEKPDHLTEDVWQQHLDWLHVVEKTVDANYARHTARVKEDSTRNEALREAHERALQAHNRTTSLFTRRY
ncbi:MAG: hypothetical protein AAGA91_10395 [Pseudomonadota bacterium]